MINERQYVPHSTNTMGNGKIMELVAEHGMEGYGIYWMLMEHLQQQKDGKSNLKVIRILSKKMRVSPQKLNKILNDFALFSVENDEVSSPELNEKRTVLEAKHKKLSEAGHKGYEAKTLKNKDNASSQAQASLYNNITTTDNNINNNSSSNRIKIQGWEASMFCQIPRLIYIFAFAHGNVIGKQLQIEFIRNLKIINKLHQYFRISTAMKCISFFLQSLFQHDIILYDTVMYKSKKSAIINLYVNILQVKHKLRYSFAYP